MWPFNKKEKPSIESKPSIDFQPKYFSFRVFLKDGTEFERKIEDDFFCRNVQSFMANHIHYGVIWDGISKYHNIDKIDYIIEIK